MTGRTVGSLLSDVGIAGSLALGVILVQPRGPVGRRLVAAWHQMTVAREVKRDWPALREGLRLDRGSSPVQIVEFADYQCPACRAANPAVQKILSQHAGIGIVFHDFPLPSLHPRAESAATASLCAARQGRFRAMHDELFKTSRWIRDGNWVREAEAAGVPDLALFDACLKDSTAVNRVAAEKRLGEKIGVRGTPTFVFADGDVVTGGVSAVEILNRAESGVQPTGSGVSGPR